MATSRERANPRSGSHLRGECHSLTVKYDVSCKVFVDAFSQLEDVLFFASLLRVFFF